MSFVFHEAKVFAFDLFFVMKNQFRFTIEQLSHLFPLNRFPCKIILPWLPVPGVPALVNAVSIFIRKICMGDVHAHIISVLREEKNERGINFTRIPIAAMP